MQLSAPDLETGEETHLTMKTKVDRVDSAELTLVHTGGEKEERSQPAGRSSVHCLHREPSRR